MNYQDYRDFFEEATRDDTPPATRGVIPFPYQERLATSEKLPELLSVPTGAGKTAAVVLGWLWRRRYAEKTIQDATPRRLVYCLPMRVLVEQTADECRKWLDNLGLSKDGSKQIGVHILMGGERDNDWDLYPERDAILIGTQDMLLSRALNRGYAASRYRWPTQFALIHSDCLWIFDETQLFGVGLKTSAQLEAFRRIFKTMFPAHSIWMSATLSEKELKTVDAREQFSTPLSRIQLEDDDKKAPSAGELQKRLGARKSLTKSAPTLTDDTKKTYAKDLAESIVNTHRARGGQTLVVMNTVGRAQDTYTELEKLVEHDEPAILLIHSRFRPYERTRLSKQLKDAPSDAGRIVVATQAIEAGVDITSKTLITELAPWSSLVQRFGRCNRYGECKEDNVAQVYWIDLQLADKDPLPYTAPQMNKAREILETLTDVGFESVEGLTDGLPEPISHVIRRKDMVELFDTTPDLAGADIDISRFIRDDNNLDVQIYWRDFGEKPGTDEPKPFREELCSVRVSAFREFLKKRTKDKLQFWIWDTFDGTWSRLDQSRIRPGLVVLASAEAGGYDDDKGWSPETRTRVSPIAQEQTTPEESNTDDPYTNTGRFISIADHSDHVVAETELLLNALGIEKDLAEDLLLAARHHDWGKAHERFQEILTYRIEDDSPIPEGGPWAKSDKMHRIKDHPRPQFRHELASALAALQTGQSDLACYLIAAHHGKVRLSIRSMPEEKTPSKPGRRFARGIWDGELLPSCDLGGGLSPKEAINLDLEPMELGRNEEGKPSWLERALGLRERFGPFRLAYLETLLRAADCRASKKERQS